MGWYETRVFPWIIERIEGPEIRELRQACVGQARGDVLEIGLGTGKTLEHYPQINSLSAVEPNAGMMRQLEPRIAAAPFPVHLAQSRGESLPFPDSAFDSVVVSLVLCSVRDPAQVLAEARRVLRPGGRLHFFEHVASHDARVRKWQDRLNGLQRWIGCGCNLNRPAEKLIEEAGFAMAGVERRILRDMPIWPALFPMVCGVAETPGDTK